VDSRTAHAAIGLGAEADRELALDAASGGVGPASQQSQAQVLGQVSADALLLLDLRRLLRAVAARRSEAAATAVRPLDVLAGLVERFRDELEAEAAVPCSGEKE
jgi:hypothetical protein